MPNFSVNTNVAAFVALQNLSGTSRLLEVTQNRISTGHSVDSAKDNAAIFAIAQKQRADVGGLNAVKQSLDRGISTVDVGLTAANAVSDLLIEAKEKAIAAADANLDTVSQTALQNDYKAILSQIDATVKGAFFNGSNLVDSGTGAVSAIGDVSASTASVINVAHRNLTAVGGLGLTSGGFTDAPSATAEIAKIDTAIATVNNALSALGAGSRALSLARDFNIKLSDSIKVGIGNLVDADLARESAQLQSLQVKQQLGAQALSIANQSPQVVLGLFRN